MFGSLFTPRHRTAALFPDGMDRHTHILWGVDDGASTPQESLAIIRTLKSLGFSGAYCTPHIKASCPGNTPDKLRRRVNELLSAAAGEAFKLELAAEYMLDDLFEKQLRRGAMLAHDGTHLLVELPQSCLPGTWKDMISAVRDQGYTPVLAHPERYGRILEQAELLELAEREGVRFQGNVGSLGGFYGKAAASTARELHANGLYLWWGTDTHNAAMARHMPLKP